MIEVSRQAEFNIHSVVDLFVGLAYAMFYASFIVAYGPDIEVNPGLSAVHLFVLMVLGVIITPLSMLATYKTIEIIDDIAWRNGFNKDLFYSKD